MEETDAPYPTPDAGSAGGSGGLDDPYPYPTDSDSTGVPMPTPTADESGSGGADVPYPTESAGTGSGTGTSTGGGGGGGGYSPVPKPSGLEFPVEACYTACTPLANLAEVRIVLISMRRCLYGWAKWTVMEVSSRDQSCNYYPIDVDINSACICTSAAQSAFVSGPFTIATLYHLIRLISGKPLRHDTDSQKSCFDCQLQTAPMNGDLQYYQGLMDRMSPLSSPPNPRSP
jgi:hypothetical protein